MPLPDGHGSETDRQRITALYGAATGRRSRHLLKKFLDGGGSGYVSGDRTVGLVFGGLPRSGFAVSFLVIREIERRFVRGVSCVEADTLRLEEFNDFRRGGAGGDVHDGLIPAG